MLYNSPEYKAHSDKQYTSSRIILAEEKHGDRYLDASDYDNLAASALWLLTMRDLEGYWYDKPKFSDEKKKILALTDEEIEAIPTEEARETVKRQRVQVNREAIRYNKDLRWWKLMRQVVDNQDLGELTLKNGKTVNKAWYLLEQRSDCEYERVSLDTIHGFLNTKVPEHA